MIKGRVQRILFDVLPDHSEPAMTVTEVLREARKRDPSLSRRIVGSVLRRMFWNGLARHKHLGGEDVEHAYWRGDVVRYEQFMMLREKHRAEEEAAGGRVRQERYR